MSEATPNLREARRMLGKGIVIAGVGETEQGKLDGRGSFQLLAEVTRLRRRVRELEEQVAAYEAELVGSSAGIVSLHEAELDAALRELHTTEPALT